MIGVINGPVPPPPFRGPAHPGQSAFFTLLMTACPRSVTSSVLNADVVVAALTQSSKDLHLQRVTVLAALALLDPDHHPLAVDVSGELQENNFRHAQSGGIDGGQRGATFEARNHLQKSTRPRRRSTRPAASSAHAHRRYAPAPSLGRVSLRRKTVAHRRSGLEPATRSPWQLNELGRRGRLLGPNDRGRDQNTG